MKEEDTKPKTQLRDQVGPSGKSTWVQDQTAKTRGVGESIETHTGPSTGTMEPSKL